MKNLVVDGSNILWRTYHAALHNNRSSDAEELSAMAHHVTLNTLNKYYQKVQPDRVVMIFDKPNNWRKMYTLSEDCLSGKKYKGNRRQNMTPSEKQRFDEFIKHMIEFEEIIRVYTKIVVLSGEIVEGDDFIACFVQRFTDQEHVIVSADKDLLQLLRQDRVSIIDPGNKPRNLQEWDNDPDYFMFEKCLRGDTGDNVQSAFPGVRKTRIKKAYEDAFEHGNMMNHEWTDKDGKTFRVGDLFEENKLLMDLTYQPDPVRDLANKTIDEMVANPGKFNWMKMLKFLKDNRLNEIKDNIERFMPLLS
jgi:5'-3' exonuclease